MTPSRFLEEIPRELIAVHEDEKPVTVDTAADFFSLMKSKLIKPAAD